MAYFLRVSVKGTYVCIIIHTQAVDIFGKLITAL